MENVKDDNSEDGRKFEVSRNDIEFQFEVKNMTYVYVCVDQSDLIKGSLCTTFQLPKHDLVQNHKLK